jgi:hypothetical protein
MLSSVGKIAFLRFLPKREKNQYRRILEEIRSFVEISDFHGGEYKDYSFLGCCSV